MRQEQHVTGITSTIQRAQQGDRAAFEQLYREHVDRVYALCLRMAANTDAAEELTQDVFVRLWNVLGSFRGESAFSTWLHRLTVNVALLSLRSQRRRAARIFGVHDLAPFDRVEDTPKPGERIDLEHAIASLPEKARLILVLHDIEGYRHEEIAEMMGLSAGTSKSQLHRARKLMKERLKK